MQQHRHSDRVDFAARFAGVRVLSDDEIARIERATETTRKRDRLASCGVGETLSDEDRERILGGRLKRTEPITLVERWDATAPAPGCPTARLEEHSRGWLVLCGGMGTGKSVAAAWWLSRHGGIYMSWQRLVELYASREVGLDASRARAEDRLDTIARATCLVIDELGAERAKKGSGTAEQWRGTVSEAWLWLVDNRKTRRKRTLVLSNLSSRDFVSRHRDGGPYDPRAYDRLRACSDVHEVAGGSLRAKAPA